MANSIATAYVNIVPTAEGIKGKLSKILEGEAGTAGTSGGKVAAEKFTGALTTAATVGTAAITAAGTAVAALVKSSVSGFAEYEQLIGGVETLFKGSADKVSQNADNAFRTAGLSANQYMETVTSFSASLLQSLGGDTDKAADYADRAIVDMSDNANKMGTSMESIQNAYQGFAKQNYTMLDNLKLGYGGTKEEMARLISDASKMTDVQKKLNVSVDEGDMSFGNIVNAISVMQESLGIAGTTALEAGSTISGSVGSLKAAWENLVVGFSSGSANLSELIGNVVESAKTTVKNIMPVVEQAIQGVGEFIKEVAPIVVAELPNMVSTILPPLLSSAGSLLTAIVEVLPTAGTQVIQVLSSAIIENLPGIIEAGNRTSLALIDAIMQVLPQLITVGVESVSQMTAGIGQALPQLIPAAVDAVLTIVETLVDNMPMIIDASLQLITGLAEGLINAIPILVEKIPRIVSSIVQTLIEAVPKIAETGIKLLSALVQGMSEITTNITGKVGELLKNILDKIKGGIKDMVQAGKDLLDGLRQGIQDKISAVVEKIKNLGQSIVDGIKDFFGIHSPSTVFKEIGGSLIEGLVNGLGEAWKGVTEFFTKAVQAIPEFFKNLPENIMKVGSNIIGKLKEGASNTWNTAKTKFTEIASNISNAFKDVPGKLLTAGSNMIEKLKSGISEKWSTAKTKVTEIANSIPKGFEKAKDNLLTVGKNVATGLGNGLSQGYSNVKTALDTVRTNVSNWMHGVNNMKDNLLTVGKNLMIGLQNGLVEAANNALNAAKTAASNVVNAVKGVFGVHSPSTIFAEIGENLDNGLAVGIIRRKGIVDQAMNDLTGNLAADAQVSLTGSYMTPAPSISRNTREDDIQALMAMLAQYLPMLANMRVTLDDGTLVGHMTPGINRELGTMTYNQRREVLA